MKCPLPKAKSITIMNAITFAPPTSACLDTSILKRETIPVYGILVTTIANVPITSVLVRNEDATCAIANLNAICASNVTSMDIAVVQFKRKPSTRQLIDFFLCLRSKGFVPSNVVVGFGNRLALASLGTAANTAATYIRECVDFCESSSR